MNHIWITRYFVLASGIALFALGGVLAYLDKTASAIATYGFAVLCLFYVFLPEFKRFKGFGVEAELLEKKIEEADRLLGQLRHLATPMAEMLFSLTARMGRWDSMVPRRDRYRLMEMIEGQLTAIGVTVGTIESAKNDWHKYNVIDMAFPLYKGVQEKIQAKIRVKDEALRTFPQPIPAGNVEYQQIIEQRTQLYAEQAYFEKWTTVTRFEMILDYLEKAIRESVALTPEERERSLTSLKRTLKTSDSTPNIASSAASNTGFLETMFRRLLSITWQIRCAPDSVLEIRSR